MVQKLFTLLRDAKSKSYDTRADLYHARRERENNKSSCSVVSIAKKNHWELAELVLLKMDDNTFDAKTQCRHMSHHR